MNLILKAIDIFIFLTMFKINSKKYHHQEVFEQNLILIYSQ
jgi:hypothetical protein